MKNTPKTSTTGTLDNYPCENICGVKILRETKPNRMKHFMILIFTIITFMAQAQSVYKRTVQWNFDGYTFTDQLTFNYSDYNYYRGLSKTQPYGAYAIDHNSHPYLLQLAKALDKDAKDRGYTGYKLAEYLTAFVQQGIHYRSDPYNNGYDYPKYPIETIIEDGDCEDKAALLVALLNTFGFDAIMVELPGHMVAAMSCANCGGYYQYNGKKYSFIETTSSRNIGDIPYEYLHTNATMLPVATSAHYKRGEATTYTPPIDNGGSNWSYNQGGNGNNGATINISSSSLSNSYSTSTVTVNGVSYQVKGSGSTSIIVNGNNVTITHH